MPKNQIITVEGHEILIFSQEGEDFICLTDMIKNYGEDSIKNRIKGKDTIEFLGGWESIHNPNFRTVEFHRLRNEAGTNRFLMSVQKWKDAVDAIGIFSKKGKYGAGTYAHKDIAFEFASWLSPMFKLYIIKEFQRLKEKEQRNLSLGRDVKRLISKANYRIHTDAIKENLVDKTTKQTFLYATEAEVLNIAIFGLTSSERESNNPKKAKNGNIRDDASVEELTVLSNLEVLNAEMIKNGIPQEKRLEILETRAKEQLKILSTLNSIKKLKEKQKGEETNNLGYKK